MLEKALRGGRRYWGWLAVLGVVIVAGLVCYLRQLEVGLGITGMSRDVTWGFYIAQFTFLVGVAASAVIVVLPYYLHDAREFAKVTVLGEFLAVSAVTMCLMFILADLGQPGRMFNMILHPSPRSILFWDMIVLNGYLVLNAVITRVTLKADRRGEAPPRWIRPVILLSIPWAISIHTVTAFIYSGLAGRPFWLTAVLAPRFLASAFCSGPALLVLICLLLARLTRYDVGRKAVERLETIITYALLANVFLLLMEVFTVFYSAIPEHLEHFRYLFFGLGEHTELVPWSWASELLLLLALLLLLVPALRRRQGALVLACLAIIGGVWIEKGLLLVVAGFNPTPLGGITPYVPTAPELAISFGIYAVGALLVTVFYRIALAVRQEVEA